VELFFELQFFLHIFGEGYNFFDFCDIDLIWYIVAENIIAHLYNLRLIVVNKRKKILLLFIYDFWVGDAENYVLVLVCSAGGGADRRNFDSAESDIGAGKNSDI
jgi:hypothetical protein